MLPEPTHNTVFAATSTAAAAGSPSAVVLLDGSGAELATIDAGELQLTKALSLALLDTPHLKKKTPEPSGAIAVTVCAHFARDGTCKRKHRCRFAHYTGANGGDVVQAGPRRAAPPLLLEKATSCLSALHDESPTTREGPTRPFASTASSGTNYSTRGGRSGGSGAAPRATLPQGGIRVYGRRGWSHAAYAAVPVVRVAV